MKNKLILFLLFFSVVAYSQETELQIPNNHIGLSFFPMISSTIELEYEHIFNQNSIMLSGGFTLKENEQQDVVGGLGEFQFRNYSFVKVNELPFGIYLGPFVKYRFVSFTSLSEWSGDVLEEYHIISGGFLIGIKYYILQKIYFDFNIGGGLKYSINDNKFMNNYLGIQRLDYSGVIPVSNFSIGLTLD